MPELPEVETIRRHLAPRIEGRTITAFEILDSRWCQPIDPGEFTAAVVGRKLERFSRRGKYLVWELSDEVYLRMHLRMTGTLALGEVATRAESGQGEEKVQTVSGGAVPRYSRVRFEFDDGKVVLFFVDPRRFGTGELSFGRHEHEEFFDQRLGIEPLSNDFTGAALYELAQRSRAPIKALLLNQRVITGVGNIYADEALFRARIHPLTEANRLSRGDCALLRDAIVESLNAGLDAKGASIDDFRDPDGVQGAFQDQFLVHRREGEPCPRCGTTIIKIRAAGRGTYLCPHCQRLAR